MSDLEKLVSMFDCGITRNVSSDLDAAAAQITGTPEYKICAAEEPISKTKEVIPYRPGYVYCFAKNDAYVTIVDASRCSPELDEWYYVYTPELVTYEKVRSYFENLHAGNISQEDRKLYIEDEQRLMKRLYKVRTIFVECTLPQSCEGVLSPCHCAETITFLPNCDYSEVETMDSMFNGCDAMTIIMSGVYAPKLRSAKEMFAHCQRLICPPDIDSWEVPILEDVTCMFKDSGLKCMVINWNMPALKTAKQMFTLCQHLQWVKVYLNAPQLVDAYGMFEDCRNLQSVDKLVLNAPQLVDIRWLFTHCYELKRVDMFEIDAGSMLMYDNLFGNRYMKQVSFEKWNPSINIDILRLGCEKGSSFILQDGSLVTR